MPTLSPVQVDNLRTAARRSVDEILRAWPHAQLDAASIGFVGRNSDGGSSPGSHSDPTATAAMAVGPAVAWLAQVHDVIAALVAEPGDSRLVGYANSGPSPVLRNAWRMVIDLRPVPADQYRALYHLADLAALWWPPPPKKGSKIAGVTVGERGNDVESCGLCEKPVVGGRDERTGQLTLRRIDGQAFHASPEGCYWTIWRQRRGGAAMTVERQRQVDERPVRGAA